MLSDRAEKIQASDFIPSHGEPTTGLMFFRSDPEAIEILKTYNLSQDPRFNPLEWKSAIEALSTAGLAPPDWADKFEGMFIRPRAMMVVIRNPRVAAAAERLLLDALAAEAQRAVDEESANRMRNGYAGIIDYDESLGQVYDLGRAFECASAVPCSNSVGWFRSGWVRDDSKTARVLVDPKSTWSGQKSALRGWPLALACAAYFSEEWVRAIYALGLAPVMLRDSVGTDRWFLMVRDGLGWPWPEVG